QLNHNESAIPTVIGVQLENCVRRCSRSGEEVDCNKVRGIAHAGQVLHQCQGLWIVIKRNSNLRQFRRRLLRSTKACQNRNDMAWLTTILDSFYRPSVCELKGSRLPLGIQHFFTVVRNEVFQQFARTPSTIDSDVTYQLEIFN